MSSFQLLASTPVIPSRSLHYYEPEGNIILQVWSTSGLEYIHVELTQQIQVENKVFNVPKAVLRNHSTIFNDMFVIGGQECLEGSTDETPVVLAGVKLFEFETLMDFMMGRYVMFLVSSMH